MKAVVFLSVLIGVLLSLLIYFGSRYFNGGQIKNPHTKIIARTADGTARTFCYAHVEYLVVNANGTAVTQLTDTSGKPIQCDY